jgi:hypothetical protein
MRSRPVKDAATRAREARLITSQLEDLGIPEADLAPLKAALDAFAREGHGLTETYRLRALGVRVTLQLSTQPHVTSFARVGRLF